MLSALGAEVALRRYPGMPHTINQEELEEARRLIIGAVGSSVSSTSHN